MVIGKSAGSTGVEVLAGTLLELLAGKLVVVVSVNRGAVAVRFTETGNGTGPATTDLIWGCVIMNLPVLLITLLSIHPFYSDYGSLPFFCLLPSASTKLLQY